MPQMTIDEMYVAMHKLAIQQELYFMVDAMIKLVKKDTYGAAEFNTLLDKIVELKIELAAL